MHDKDGAFRAGRNVGRNAARDPAAEPGTAMRTQDDQARIVLLSDIQDRLPGGRALNRQRIRPKASGVG
jgi:hypothetical protein